MTLAALVPAAPAGAAEWSVANGQSIQAAIDVAAPGDVITVAPGVYVERLDFHGKAVEVRSSGGPFVTTIRGDGTGPVVVFQNGETRASVLRGFTVRDGKAPFDYGYEGAGIHIASASPTIAGNVVTGNTDCASGTGISVAFGSPLIQGNTISDNSLTTGCSGQWGGGIYVRGASAQTVIEGNTIQGNVMAGGSAGGIGLFAAGAVTVQNNVIRWNRAGSGGSAIDVANASGAWIGQNLVADNSGGIAAIHSTSALTLQNNTLARNGGSAVALVPSTTLRNNVLVGPSPVVRCDAYTTGTPTMAFNDVWPTSGAAYDTTCTSQTGVNGNTSADPRFVDPVTTPGDFRLAAGSPAIDAGDPATQGLAATDLAGAPRLADGNGNGSVVVDQGAYEAPKPAPTAPGAPTNVTVVRSGPKNAVVSWSPPASDGGSPITGYVVTSSGGGSKSVSATTRSVTFTGLNKKSAYTFTVYARNAVGQGAGTSVVLPKG